MPKSKSRGIIRPDVKAIATRAERARPRLPGLSAQERAAEARRLAADEKRLRASLAKAMDVAALERFARERDKSDLERAKAAHRRAIAASSDRAKWLAMQSVPANVLAPADGEDQFIVDTALFMRAWPNTGALRDFSTGPDDNWGKYRLEVDGDILDTSDEARLSFTRSGRIHAMWP
jgi:phage gpG-like protein